MKRLMIVGLGLLALTVSGCCCGHGLCGGGGGCGGGCGTCGSNYPAYQGAYAAPMGGSCGCN